MNECHVYLSSKAALMKLSRLTMKRLAPNRRAIFDLGIYLKHLKLHFHLHFCLRQLSSGITSLGCSYIQTLWSISLHSFKSSEHVSPHHPHSDDSQLQSLLSYFTGEQSNRLQQWSLAKDRRGHFSDDEESSAGGVNSSGARVRRRFHSRKERSNLGPEESTNQLSSDALVSPVSLKRLMKNSSKWLLELVARVDVVWWRY